MTKAETLQQSIAAIADKISEANSKGIADGFTHAQLGIIMISVELEYIINDPCITCWKHGMWVGEQIDRIRSSSWI